MSARLDAQFAFLLEADRLKSVLRASQVSGSLRRENSGEHSWHVALYAMVLADQAGPDVRIERVIRMLLIHDLVEIDTGDVPLHSAGGQAHGSAAVQAAESAAADRLFGLLPPDQAADYRALWDEFEAATSPDARFAKSLDRVQPVLQNLATDGGTWVEYNVTRPQMEDRVGARITGAAPGLWGWISPRLDAWFRNR